MLIIVLYDVNTQTASGKKRLRSISKICRSYGIRVQYSVYECDIDPSQYILMKKRIEEVINPEEDRVRFYNLGKTYNVKIERLGKTFEDDQEDALIF